MNVKDRVCSPSPHISNLSVDVIVFLQKAAGAFSRPPAVANEFINKGTINMIIPQ
jgi:hypothetical protein